MGQLVVGCPIFLFLYGLLVKFEKLGHDFALGHRFGKTVGLHHGEVVGLVYTAKFNSSYKSAFGYF